MNFTAKGGDGAETENMDVLAISSIVSVKMPSKIAKELGYLNPSTGIILAVSHRAIHVQVLPDKHPKTGAVRKALEIPHELIKIGESYQKSSFHIVNSGQKILSRERYAALNRRMQDLEVSSKELAQTLIDDPETVQYWRDYIYLRYCKEQQSLSELAQSTHKWLKDQAWFKASEEFHLAYLVNALLQSIYDMDLDL